MLSVAGLGIAYPDSPQLFQNLNFEVRPGQVLCLRGPNGCGKTTLLYALSNLIPQVVQAVRTGIIWLGGRQINDLPLNQLSPLLSLSYSDPQREFFFTCCEDEIIFALENLGLSSAEITLRLAETGTRLGLEEKLGQPSSTLSYGWQKLAVLAVHLAIRPQALLLDEPLSGLSGIALEKAVGALKAYTETGGILVLAEHSPAAEQLVPAYLDLADWKD